MRPRVACAALALTLVAQAASAQLPPGPRIADAGSGDLRVFATGAIREALSAVVPAASQSVGAPLFVEYGSARGNLRSEILAGQEFEVAILTPDVTEELLQHGAVLPQSVAVAHVDIAIGLRGDVASMDVSSPKALKRAMLAARSVRYSPTGGAVMTMQKIALSLGLADQIRDTSRETQPVALAAGEYELNFYPLSEILPNKALKNLGAVIPELQIPLTINAVIGSRARDPKAARALLEFLQGPDFEAALKADGMIKGGA